MATQVFFPAQTPRPDHRGGASRPRRPDNAAHAIVARLKHVKIATASSVLLSINLFLLICACLLFLLTETANGAAETALRGRSAQLEVAHELGRSSSQMTRLARSYAVTGEDRYSRLYDQFIQIRKGRSARPRPYNDIYADLIIAGHTFNSRGRTVSLLTLAREAGYPEREFALFQRAARAADELAEIEAAATAAIRASGWRRFCRGNMAWRAQRSRSLSRN